MPQTGPKSRRRTRSRLGPGFIPSLFGIEVSHPRSELWIALWWVRETHKDDTAVEARGRKEKKTTSFEYKKSIKLD